MKVRGNFHEFTRLCKKEGLVNLQEDGEREVGGRRSRSVQSV